MNQSVVKSCFRSVQRGTRTMEQVPEELREAVRALLAPGTAAPEEKEER